MRRLPISGGLTNAGAAHRAVRADVEHGNLGRHPDLPDPGGSDQNDTLSGGGGDDTLWGHGGNDLYVVDAGDAVIETALADGIDTIETASSYTLDTVAAQFIENVTLTGASAANAVGNALANVLRGNAAGNTLSGLDGNDVLEGGGDNDVLSGGAGVDTASTSTRAQR